MHLDIYKKYVSTIGRHESIDVSRELLSLKGTRHPFGIEFTVSPA